MMLLRNLKAFWNLKLGTIKTTRILSLAYKIIISCRIAKLFKAYKNGFKDNLESVVACK